MIELYWVVLWQRGPPRPLAQRITFRKCVARQIRMATAALAGASFVKYT